MGMFTPPNNSAIMGAAPREKLGVAGGILNMTRSLGSIFGVGISGLVFTSLEHSYITGKGYADVTHVFSGNSIPADVRDSAFMHGFEIAVAILLGITIVSAVLSITKKEGEALDSEAVKEFEGI
jgi:MFS family permease